MINLSKSTDDNTRRFITTRRLYFRTWRKDDFNLAMDLWGDPKVTRFIVAKGCMSDDEVKARLFQEIDTQKSHGVQYWPCFLQSNNAFVGCCGIRLYDLSKEIYEIGFHILSCCWRKGLAVEAARGVMEYAFKELPVAGLFAGHHPDNIVSPHVLEKLGFQYTHDEFYAPTGLKHPSYILNREDYFQTTQQ
jgi:RimJ/RimL family protein N-acetyltransferase